jgi:hypothetical protein
MTEKQLTQSAVMVDGDISKSFYESKMKELEGATFNDLKNLDDTYKKQLNAAIKEQYGETARIDDKGVVTYQKDGKDATIPLPPEQMKSMIATQYATEQSVIAIENSAEALKELSKTLGTDVVDALYGASEG